MTPATTGKAITVANCMLWFSSPRRSIYSTMSISILLTCYLPSNKDFSLSLDDSLKENYHNTITTLSRKWSFLTQSAHNVSLSKSRGRCSMHMDNKKRKRRGNTKKRIDEVDKDRRRLCNGGRGVPIMMGLKERLFAPRVSVSLEELVPQDNFYRHVQKVLDLSFVRNLVRERYAVFGRPSIDPVVFFKLQLVMFFEDIRSERLLMQLVADKLSVRWYVGYNLDEPLPDHSSLTRIRERYGVEVFRRFFEVIVEQCQAAGLVWGNELYFDGTKVQANASVDSLTTRFAVEAREALQRHLEELFQEENEQQIPVPDPSA